LRVLHEALLHRVGEQVLVGVHERYLVEQHVLGVAAVPDVSVRIVDHPQLLPEAAVEVTHKR